MTTGQRIKLARGLARLTQRKLSEKSGYTIWSISAWENGHETPSDRAVKALEEVLGTKLRK